MVALGRELCLRGLRVVEVERIVDRHRHELRDLAQEGYVRGRPGDRQAAADAKRTDPPARGRERQTAEGEYPPPPDSFHGPGPTRLGARGGDDEGLLRVDQPGRRAVGYRQLGK